jgi:DNA-binding transcriptional LysR family regulator
MRSLEDVCGVKLVERLGNRVQLTPAGAALHASVRGLVRVERDVEAVIDGLRQGDQGSITVGGNTTGGMYIVPQIVRHFRSRSPSVDIKLAIADTPSILEDIADHAIDVAVVGGPVDPHRYDVRFLCKDELVPVASAEHPLAGGTELTLKDVGSEPIVLPSTGSTTRAFILQRFREQHVQIHVAMEFNATENVKKAVESNLGIGIISRWAIQRELALGILTVIDVDGFPIEREYQIVSRQPRGHSPTVERFIATVEEVRPLLELGK